MENKSFEISIMFTDFTLKGEIQKLHNDLLILRITSPYKNLIIPVPELEQEIYISGRRTAGPDTLSPDKDRRYNQSRGW